MDTESRVLPSFASILHATKAHAAFSMSGGESYIKGEMQHDHIGSPVSSEADKTSPLLSAMSSISSNLGAAGAGWSSCSSNVQTPSVSPPPARSVQAEKSDSPQCGPTSSKDQKCPLPPLSLSAKSEPSADAHKQGVPLEKVLGANRVGGEDWVARRKCDSMNRAYHHGSNNRQLQIAQVRKAVDRLQGALPVEAKMIFLQDIRRYLTGETSPEDFAEIIKKLVDDHGVVIPLNDLPIGGWRRPAECEGESKPASRLGKRGHAGALKGTAVVSKRVKEDSTHKSGADMKGRASEAGRRGARGRNSKGASFDKGASLDMHDKGHDSAKAAALDDDTSAWEALLSVCSGITKSK